MHQTPFACLVSPGGGAFAIFACPRVWAFANPRAFATHRVDPGFIRGGVADTNLARKLYHNLF